MGLSNYFRCKRKTDSRGHSKQHCVKTAQMAAADIKSPSAKLSSDDSNFVKEAAQGGLMEVQLGKLAQEKAANEKVKTVR